MNKVKKEPVDNSVHYAHTEFPARDGIYNWIVRRYGNNGVTWKKSDTAVFHGFIYQVWPWVPALMFIWFTYWIANWTYDRYGMFRALTVLAVMCLIRVNALVRNVNYTNRILKERLQ